MDSSPFSPTWDLSESKMVHFADQVAKDMNRSAMHRQMQSPSLARLAQSNLYASRTSNISSMSVSYRNNQSRGGPQQQSVDGTFDGLRDLTMNTPNGLSKNRFDAPYSPATPAPDPIDCLNDASGHRRHTDSASSKNASLMWGNDDIGDDDDAAFGMLTPLDERNLRLNEPKKTSRQGEERLSAAIPPVFDSSRVESQTPGNNGELLTPNFGATLGGDAVSLGGGTPFFGRSSRFQRDTPGGWMGRADKTPGESRAAGGGLYSVPRPAFSGGGGGLSASYGAPPTTGGRRGVNFTKSPWAGGRLEGGWEVHITPTGCDTVRGRRSGWREGEGGQDGLDLSPPARGTPLMTRLLRAASPPKPPTHLGDADASISKYLVGGVSGEEEEDSFILAERQAEIEAMAMESDIRRRGASSAPGTSPGGASSGRASPPRSASASASSGPIAPARRRSQSPEASNSSRGGLRSSSSSLAASPSMDPAYLQPTPTPEAKGRRPSAMASSSPMSRGTPTSSARGAPQSAGGTPKPSQKSGACSSGGQTPNPRKLSESPPREAASPSPEQASGAASPMAWRDASLIASAAVGVGPASKADVSCPVVEASSSSSSLSTGEACKQGESRADSAAAVRGAEWRDASMLASAFLRETAPISVEADVVAAGEGRGDRVDREASGLPITEGAEVEREAGGVPITEDAVVQDGGQSKMAIAGSGSNSNSNSNSNSVSPSARASSPSPSRGQADASRLLDSVYLRPSASPEARATAGQGQGQSVLWESEMSVPGQGMSGSVMSVGGEEALVASAREEMSRVISSRGSSPERGDWMGSGAPLGIASLSDQSCPISSSPRIKAPTEDPSTSQFTSSHVHAPVHSVGGGRSASPAPPPRFTASRSPSPAWFEEQRYAESRNARSPSTSRCEGRGNAVWNNENANANANVIRLNIKSGGGAEEEVADDGLLTPIGFTPRATALDSPSLAYLIRKFANHEGSAESGACISEGARGESASLHQQLHSHGTTPVAASGADSSPQRSHVSNEDADAASCSTPTGPGAGGRPIVPFSSLGLGSAKCSGAGSDMGVGRAESFNRSQSEMPVTPAGARGSFPPQAGGGTPMTQQTASSQKVLASSPSGAGVPLGEGAEMTTWPSRDGDSQQRDKSFSPSTSGAVSSKDVRDAALVGGNSSRGVCKDGKSSAASSCRGGEGGGGGGEKSWRERTGGGGGGGEGEGMHIGMEKAKFADRDGSHNLLSSDLSAASTPSPAVMRGGRRTGLDHMIQVSTCSLGVKRGGASSVMVRSNAGEPLTLCCWLLAEGGGGGGWGLEGGGEVDKCVLDSGCTARVAVELSKGGWGCATLAVLALPVAASAGRGGDPFCAYVKLSSELSSSADGGGWSWKGGIEGGESVAWPAERREGKMEGQGVVSHNEGVSSLCEGARGGARAVGGAFSLEPLRGARGEGGGIDFGSCRPSGGAKDRGVLVSNRTLSPVTFSMHITPSHPSDPRVFHFGKHRSGEHTIIHVPAMGSKEVRVEANFPQIGGPSSDVARRYEAELIGVPITGKGGEDAAVAYLSMRLGVVCGESRIQIPSAIHGVVLCCEAGATCSSVVPLRNSGSLPALVSINLEGNSGLDLLSVRPASLQLKPGAKGSVRISFRPRTGGIGSVSACLSLREGSHEGAHAQARRVPITAYTDEAAEHRVPLTVLNHGAGGDYSACADVENRLVSAHGGGAFGVDGGRMGGSKRGRGGAASMRMAAAEGGGGGRPITCSPPGDSADVSFDLDFDSRSAFGGIVRSSNALADGAGFTYLEGQVERGQCLPGVASMGGNGPSADCARLSFPDTKVGKRSELRVALCNRSEDNDVKIEIRKSDGVFGVGRTKMSIRPGHYLLLPVYFKPVSSGRVSRKLEIACGNGGVKSVVLSGRGM